MVPFVLLGLAGVVSAAFPPWFQRASAKLDARSTTDLPPAPQPVPPAPAAAGSSSRPRPTPATTNRSGCSCAAPRPAGPCGSPTEGTDLSGRRWRAAADLVAEADGTVDAATTVPTAGNWATADPTAPLWAMRFAEPGAVPDLFVPPPRRGW